MDYLRVSDEELWQGCRSGDVKAYNALYKRYSRQLILFCTHKLNSLETAEELVNDTFVTLWEKRDQVEVHSNMASYLFTMVKNGMLQYLRRKKDIVELVEEMSTIEVADTVQTEDNIYYQELYRDLTLITDNLPERCGKIFQMSRNEQKSTREIAEELNLSDQTVKNQLTKALKVIRLKLRDVTYFFF